MKVKCFAIVPSWSRCTKFRRTALSLAWHEWFSRKGKEWKIYRYLYIYSSRCRQNLKTQNFTPSFGRLCEKIAPKSVQHDHSTYQIIDLWSCRCCRHFLNSLFVNVAIYDSPSLPCKSLLSLGKSRIFYNI